VIGGEEDPDEEPPPKKLDDPPPKKHDDDDKPKKHDDEVKKDDDRPKKHTDDDRPKKRVADDDTSVRKHSDDDEGRHHKKRHHKAERDPLTQETVWLDAGLEAARRTLTYGGSGTAMPPRVGTAGFAGRVDGEVYPAASDTLQGAAAFGLYGEVSKTVGLGIAVPGTSVTAAINDAHFEAGARYRFVFGQSSFAIGAAYWKRYYIADRSALMAGQTLDMPDVNYSAVAPDVLLRFPATPTVNAYAQVDVPLVLASGDIGSATSYGRGTIIAFDIRGGAQITLGDHYALQLAAEFDQVGIKFLAGDNSKAMQRGVSSVTDRSVGITATLGIFY